MFAIVHNNLESSIGPFVDTYNLKLYNNTLEKLKLIKSNMNTIISLADWYSKDTGKPFSELLKIGMCSAIKAIGDYKRSNNEEFNEYLKREVSKSMLRYASKAES